MGLNTSDDITWNWVDLTTTTGGPFTVPPPQTSTPQRVSTMPPPTTTPTTTKPTTPTPTTTVPHNCPRSWGFYTPTYDCYDLKPFYQFNYTENLYCNGSIRTDGENEYVANFATGFFAGVGTCFTGQSDLEMFMIGNARSINGNPMWQDGEPMNYAPQADGCPTLIVPSNGYTPIIATIDPHGKVCWQAIGDTNFGSIPSSCQYFLCKKDGH
ncbi:hypothetical protein WR25_19107 [Diploscapter pachys]|uniref:C-type lectin domain-containing protein n=1 Tax=Diploscapter pachys TaxID=2018661 RepID=A0A2A2L371_9BILA|nr:hypothetical protein WR25_19107 [Diploscapter pachys]